MESNYASHLLRVVFFTEMQLLDIRGDPAESLAVLIEKTGVKFTGYTPYFSETHTITDPLPGPHVIGSDGTRSVIVAYTRIPGEGREL